MALASTWPVMPEGSGGGRRRQVQPAAVVPLPPTPPFCRRPTPAPTPRGSHIGGDGVAGGYGLCCGMEESRLTRLCSSARTVPGSRPYHSRPIAPPSGRMPPALPPPLLLLFLSAPPWSPWLPCGCCPKALFHPMAHCSPPTLQKSGYNAGRPGPEGSEGSVADSSASVELPLRTWGGGEGAGYGGGGDGLQR